ncbi:MAG: glycosyltransferase family 39 protein [Thermoanaerobaculales bacterium]|jgi:hypothetical protein|nr:glycosyltransferase family 39 protein [Thermoanaerobaculales bacterium]
MTARNEPPAGTSNRSDGRLATSAAVLAVTVIAGAVMVRYGSLARIEYDGWWHVFVARAWGWSAFWREVYAVAHPPLYFLILKAASAVFGTSQLAYRTVSIASGMVSVALVGLIAVRVFSHRVLAVVTALAFGVSTAAVVVSNQIRSYTLAVVFLLLCVYCLLDLVDPATKNLRMRALFSLSLTLGILSHFSILFMLPVFASIPFLIVLIYPDLRASYLKHWKRYFGGHFLMLLLPAAVAVEEYVFHIRKISGSAQFHHLRAFFYDGSEGLVSFTLRNLLNEVRLFFPTEILGSSSNARIISAMIVMIVIVGVVAMLRARGAVRATTIPLVATVLLGVLWAVAVLGRYPFGGTVRHQFLLYPVAVLTFFLFVDRCLEFIHDVRRKKAAIVVFVCFVFAAVAFEWKQHSTPVRSLGLAAHDLFVETYPEARNIFVDQFSLFHLFTHRQEARWVFDSEFSGKRTDRIEVTGDGGGFTVYRNRRWQAHLNDASFYASLRRTMREAGLDRMTVFHMERVRRGEGLSPDQKREGNPRVLERRAEANGLRLVSSVRGRRCVFAEFELVKAPRE